MAQKNAGSPNLGILQSWGKCKSPWGAPLLIWEMPVGLLIVIVMHRRHDHECPCGDMYGGMGSMPMVSLAQVDKSGVEDYLITNQIPPVVSVFWQREVHWEQCNWAGIKLVKPAWEAGCRCTHCTTIADVFSVGSAMCTSSFFVSFTCNGFPKSYNRGNLYS